MRRRIAIVSLLILFYGVDATAKPPRLGLELTLGQNAGIDPSLDNVVILDDDVPLLVDELPGSGVDIGIAVLFTRLEISVGLHFYDRDRVIQHHRGTSTISARNRLRPDGSVDDSGVEYETVERRVVQSPSRNNGELLFGQLSGGYRLYLVERDFSLYIPFVGGLGFATVLEPTKPVSFGLQAETGVGGAYTIADPLGLVFEARLGGLLTPVYGSVADAARTSFVNQESTEATIVSSFLQFSVSVGVQIAIR